MNSDADPFTSYEGPVRVRIKKPGTKETGMVGYVVEWTTDHNRLRVSASYCVMFDLPNRKHRHVWYGADDLELAGEEPAQ